MKIKKRKCSVCGKLYKRELKIEIRKICKVCGEPITEKRRRTYCSDLCRNKFYYKKNGKRNAQWLRDKKDKEASIPDKTKIQCLICGRYYRQVGTHIYARHNMTAREYREKYGFDVKKGQVSEDLRILYGQQALENGTYKNLKQGIKYWFKKGQKGVGVYQRSDETLERLKLLYKLNKKRHEENKRL